MSPSWLPGLLGEIAEQVGIEAALKLADEVGGTRVYIPASVGPDHWLAQCIGSEAADKLCSHFCVRDAEGRELSAAAIMIPRGPTTVLAKMRRRLAREMQAGASPRKAAMKVGVTERTAYRVKARLAGGEDEDGQGWLF